MLPLPLTLLGAGYPAVDRPVALRRRRLDECCWIDVAPGFLRGGDALLADLDRDLDWGRGRRLMYGTWYDEPRLSASAPKAGCELPTVIAEMRVALTDHYGRNFTGLFCNYYPTGSDSVAWHADRIGRTEIDPLVAILSLGGPRTFAIRPFGGGRSMRIELHSGDLLVMGGATQHHWEHAVPKCRAAPPRMSVTMRAGGAPFS